MKPGIVESLDGGGLSLAGLFIERGEGIEGFTHIF